MAPPRKDIEIIYSIKNDLQHIDMSVNIIPKLVLVEMNDFEKINLDNVNQKTFTYKDLINLLLRQSCSVIDLLIDALQTDYPKIVDKIKKLKANDEYRKQLSKENNLHLPMWPNHPLPQEHVHRSEELINLIINKFNHLQSGGFVLLYGIHGSGKSQLVHELMLHSKFQDLFPGGCLRLTQNLKNIANLCEIYKYLSRLPSLGEETTNIPHSRPILSCHSCHSFQSSIRSLTHNPHLPRMLLILDHVQSKEDVKLYQNLNLSCLITSRKPNILNHISYNCEKILMPSEFSSEEIDKFWEKQFPEIYPPGEEFCHLTKQISTFCGNFPMALSIIVASYVHRRAQASDEGFVVKQLKNALKKLSKKTNLQKRFSFKIKISVKELFFDKKMTREKLTLYEKYLYLVLFNHRNVISTKALMILWEQNSVEATRIDLQILYNRSLLIIDSTPRADEKPVVDCFMLHFLHFNYLTKTCQNQINEYCQDFINKMHFFCQGQWHKLENGDPILWRILFECCRKLYSQADDYPSGLVRDLRSWNALARARGLMNAYNELRLTIRCSSMKLKPLLREFLHLIQKYSQYFCSIEGKSGESYEFIQHALFFHDFQSDIEKRIQQQCLAQSTGFYWNKIYGNIQEMNQNCFYSWNCDFHCVDDVNRIAFAGHFNGDVDILTRENNTKFSIAFNSFCKGATNIYKVKSVNLLLAKVETKRLEWYYYFLYSYIPRHPTASQTKIIPLTRVETRFNSRSFQCSRLGKTSWIFGITFKNELTSLICRYHKLKFYGKPRRLWQNESLSLKEIHVIQGGRYILSTFENKIKIFDLFTYCFISNVEFVLPKHSHTAHWLIKLCHSSSQSLFSHRTAVLSSSSSSLIILNGHLQIVEKIDFITFSQQIPILFQTIGLNVKRFKLFNVEHERYEIYYSPKWRGPTNLLSCNSQPLSNHWSYSYFSDEFKLFFHRGLREFNKFLPIKNEIRQQNNIVSLSQMRHIYSCEQWQQQQLNDDDKKEEYYRILCCECVKHSYDKEKSKSHLLQIFLLKRNQNHHLCDINNNWETFEIICYFNKRINFEDAGIRENFLWIIDDKQRTLTIAWLDNIQSNLRTRKIEPNHWKNYSISWSPNWRPCFRKDNQSEIVGLFLFNQNSSVDAKFFLYGKEQTWSDQIYVVDVENCNWRFSESIIMKIIERTWSAEHFIVSWDSSFFSSSIWPLKKLFNNHPDVNVNANHLLLATTSNHKIFAYKVARIVKIVSATDGELIQKYSQDAKHLVFYHANNFSLLALTWENYQENQAFFQILQIYHNDRAHRQIFSSNIIEVKKEISDIRFSVCGQYVVVKQCPQGNSHLVYLTYSIQQNSAQFLSENEKITLDLVNEFCLFTRESNVMILCNNSVVVFFA